MQQSTSAILLFWQTYLGDLPEALSLPGDLARPALHQESTATHISRLSPTLAAQLLKQCGATDLAPEVLFFTAFSLFIGKIANTRDFVVGMYGLPHLLHLTAEEAFLDLARRTAETLVQTAQHHPITLEALCSHLGIEGDPGRSPLFEVAFTYNEAALPAAAPNGSVDLHLQVSSTRAGPSSEPLNQQVLLTLEYNDKLFTAALIERLVRALEQALTAIATNVYQPVGGIGLLSASSQRQLLADFSTPYYNWPQHLLLHELFEARVDRDPQKVALRFDDQTWTYGELEHAANALTAALIERGVGPDLIVALLTPRSPVMMIAILAVLKAGAAYLPIDPETPPERLHYLLRDSAACLALTTTALASLIPASCPALIVAEDRQALRRFPRLSRRCEPSNLAYVIYTSGSTGEPKGVLIEHASIVHFIVVEKADLALTSADVLLQFSAYTFDASIEQMWLALASGATLVLVDSQTLLDVSLLTALIQRERITHLDTVPLALASLEPTALPSLKRVVVGGETCPVSIAKKWLAHCAFYNEYGPTEVTIAALRHRVADTYEGEIRIPIGHPIGRTRAYILDWGQCLVPIGVPGELYLGGAGVARGYLERPELTAAKFLRDPYSVEPAARMYRTGDIVRWLEGGSVDFLGRVDHQIKIRGFRIELGEVEAALAKHEGLSGAAVTVIGETQDQRRLCAYYAASRPVGVEEMRVFLSQTLPKYMIPDFFIQLESFPQTASGKLDRRRLPTPNLDLGLVEPPTNLVEFSVRALWAELLLIPAEAIGIGRHFFELGGHSLLLMQLVARLQNEFNVTLKTAAVLTDPSIRAIARLIAKGDPESRLLIPRVDVGTVRKATSVQRRLYVIQQGYLPSTAYNLPMLFEITGAIDANALAAACFVMIQRHESLRTVFFLHEGDIVQKVVQRPSFHLEQYPLAGREAKAVMDEFVRPFVLEEAPLLRAAVFQEGDQPRYVAFDMHHIIADGMSLEVFMQDLCNVLKGEALAPQPLRYFDYSAWLDSDTSVNRRHEAREYWLSLLKKELPVLDLPNDFPRPASHHHAAATIEMTLDLAVHDRILALVRQTEATPFAFFAAVYALWLSCMTGNDEVAFGYPTAGRPHPDLARILGMFVNTLIFRSQITPGLEFRHFLRQTMAQLAASIGHEDYPFEDLIEDLHIKTAAGRHPAVGTMLSYEGTIVESYDCGPAQLKTQKIAQQSARVDLVVIVRQTASGYSLAFEYSTELYTRATAERFTAGFTNLLAAALEGPAVNLGKLNAFAPGERDLVISGFNHTQHDLPAVNAAHELFEQLAASQPEAAAVIFEDGAWTYAEVEHRANALALALQRHGIGRGCIVGIVLDPCPDMLTAVLGVLKAGAAFLPIDPDYPAARKTFMLEDSHAQALLAKPSLIGEWSTLLNGPILDVTNAELYGGSLTKPAMPMQPTDAAYVIYTSGSTGKPKGVVIEHHSLINLLAWVTDYLALSSDDRVAKYAGFGFDASVLELLPAVTAGASLVIIPSEARIAIERLDTVYANTGVTVAFLPTQFAEQFLRRATKHSLRTLLVGGDKLRSAYQGTCQVINLYGPTEYTVVATAFAVTTTYANIPVGKPAWNTQILVLDRLGRLCPIGVPGELCISGEGTARGYLNRPDLTAEKFVAQPLSPARRMYRTGDLARWLSDGNLEFLGRIDTQVKIRGFRIELGEIEQSLMGLRGVSEAVVVTTSGSGTPGDLALVGYVTCSEPRREAELKSELEHFLPVYMVPSRLVVLERIPLSPNGKVDRGRLPAVSLVPQAITEPQTQGERDLRRLYAEVLAIPEATISIDTSFLSLGGHSLKAAVLLSELYKQRHVELALADFLKQSSVHQLAQYLDKLPANVRPNFVFVKAPERSAYPLSAAQSRIFAVYQLSPWSTAYNITFTWELTAEVDLNRLSRAFTALSDRHQALRAFFVLREGEPVQCFNRTGTLNLQQISADDANLKAILERFVQPFDLAVGPLVRAALIRTRSRTLLAFDIHHIIADGLSIKILLEELQQLYEGETLAEVKPSFVDYLCWEQSDAGREHKAREKPWWYERFRAVPTPLELPYDFDRPARVTFEGSWVSAELPASTSRALMNLARDQGITPLSVFLAAYAITLSRLGNTPDIVIGVPASGRHLPGLSQVVGMFVNTVPLRLGLKADEYFADLVQRLAAEAREAFERQSYQLGDLALDLALARDPARNPLFDIVFAWEDLELNHQAHGPLGLKELAPDKLPSKFDLEFTVQQTPDGQRLVLQYSTKLFLAATAEKFLGYLRSILEQAARSADVRVRDFLMLAPWEQDMLLGEFNRTKIEFPSDQTLLTSFAEYVATNPEAVAVADESESFTFAELNLRAAIVAGNLRQRGTAVGDVVALSMTRSVQLIVGILAILKAGAGYLPIEPDTPTDRANFMIEDSQATLLVSDHTNFSLPSERMVSWSRFDWTRPTADLWLAESQSVAYVIYTSGSTGKPKGVVVEHHSVVNYLRSAQLALGVDASDVVVLFSSFTFDASVAQIGMMIMAGASLVIPQKETILDLEAFEGFLRHHGVTHLFTVPLFLSSFQPQGPLNLRRVLVGGDVFPLPVAMRWAKIVPVYNEYGPTEITVAALRHKVESRDEGQGRVPVGRPIANTQIYIRDWTGNLAPIGVAGELYIGGAGIARGYLNNEELTTAKFVANPYGPGRLYRSGDLARWLPSGAVDFLGRADYQIKIRGFRIELGEIEAVLRQHPAVTETVVIVVSDGAEKRLCCYLTTNRDTPPGELRAFLSRQLPSYMVPEAYLTLAQLPVTISGKIDRQQLPPPDFSGPQGFPVATSETEEKLVDIWAQVLKLPRVRVPLDQSFFEIGGHSLLIMQLITRIHGTFGIRLTAAEVFGIATVRGQAALLHDKEREAIRPIPRVALREYYPLSSVQRRLYAIQQTSPLSVSYNIPNVFAVSGHLSGERIEEILRALIQRHSILRTAFVMHEGQPMQRVLEHVPLVVTTITDETGTIDEIVYRLMQAFDLAQAPLLRAWLVQHGDGQTYLITDMHHIIADGYAMGVLWRELAQIAKGMSLPPLTIAYADYACWQQHQDYRQQLTKQSQFWLTLYKDIPPPLELPCDFKRPLVRTQEGALFLVNLDAAELKALQDLSHSAGATLFATLLACFSLFLSRISGSDDLVIGVPATGRVHPDIQDVVGMFVNTLPVRTRIPATGTFHEFLTNIRQVALDCLSNQEYELEELFNSLGGINTLFDVMFVFQNHQEAVISAGSFSLEFQPFEHHTAKMDLVLTATEKVGGIELAFEYPTELFAASTIARLAGHFLHLIRLVMANPTITLASTELLNDAERQQLYADFNDTHRALPPYPAAHYAFEEWAATTPDATAVIFGDLRFSYGEVNRRANLIAAWLLAAGVQRGDFVGLLLDPNEAHLAAVLGILKAGAAFLPIDPEFPEGRKNLMLADSGARALLTSIRYTAHCEFHGPILDVTAPATYLDKAANVNPGLAVQPNDAAYLIYTSGSTGKPKGVVVEHGNLLNFVYWYCNLFAINNHDVLAKYAGCSFDVSIAEIFPACMTGAALAVVPKDIRLSPTELDEYFVAAQVTVAFLPTQFGEQYIRLTNNQQLRVLMVAGEKLHSYRPTPYILANGYGPTECTVLTTLFEVNRNYDNIPIGKPLWNTQVLILDKQGHLCPIGVAGELCVAGRAVARGYLGRPDLTAERFTAHPFEPHVRMYRTGDRARWLEDGNIEYQGRFDTQVKIRGYRIELGEIEQALLQLSGVSEAVVVAAADDAGGKFLVGFLVASEPLDSAAARRKLLRDLPDYMIPAQIVQLAAIPLTPNGKVDRQALPLVKPDIGALITAENDTERRLLRVWAATLGTSADRIGVTSSFFDLGGHSLKAIALVAEIYREFKVNLRVSEVFQHTSIRALALRLTLNHEAGVPDHISKRPTAASYPSSSVQKRLFLEQALDLSSVRYNIPSLFRVPSGVSRETISRALQTLANRHEAFRSSFFLGDEGPRLRVVIHCELPLPMQRTSEAALTARAVALIQPFNLEVAPLARAAWIETETAQYLYFDMHHIVTDGTSMGILMQELTALIGGKSLPPLAVDLADYAVWENTPAVLTRLAEQRQYWQTMFADGVPTLELLTDYPRSTVLSSAGATVVMDIPQALTTGLRDLARAHSLSLYSLLLAAVNTLLARLTRQEDLVVGTPVAGRWHPDMARMVGMFVNNLVLRSRPTASRSFLDFVKEVGRQVLDSLDHQACPFADLLALADRRPGHSPLFDLMFVLQNSDDRLEQAAIQFPPCPITNQTAKFDLSIIVDEYSDRLSLALEYRESLFKRSTIETYGRSFLALLTSVVNTPTASLGSLSILAETDRLRVEEVWNQTDQSYPAVASATALFEAAAKRFGERPALVFRQQSYTYAEMNARANRLAHRLLHAGLKPEEIVGILAQPSADMIIALIGVLKAGGAFLPLDHRNPTDRLDYMLQDSGARILLAAPGTTNTRDWQGERVDLGPELYATGPTANPQLPIHEHHLAYIIYTSGSTGRPKGVMIEHGSLVHFSQWLIAYLSLSERDKAAKYAGFGFDASILETMPTLGSGAALHVVPEEMRLSLPELATFYADSGITFAFLPTQIAEEFIKHQTTTQLRWLVTGGDRLRRYVPTPFKMVNAYGPTEYTVAATAFLVDANHVNIPIGKPLANTKIYILDAAGNLCAPGFPGELCIVGKSMGRGYLGNPDLTAQKFVQHPLARDQRLYRTGDLARWQDDGNLEFLGRIDSQVKIRGFRIELGEIEQALLAMAAVQTAVVIARQDAQGEPYLCAYVVGVDNLEDEVLRDHLARTLPDYMIPPAFVRLNEIPLTANGKVDRRRLPEPVVQKRDRVLIAPQTMEETMVLNAFARALGRSDLSIDDDFFELGGNSLKAVAAVATLAGDFRITANDLFRLRSARKLAAEVPLSRGDLKVRLATLSERLSKPDLFDPLADLRDDLRQYQQRCEPYETLSLSTPVDYRAVLLTGATGFLGSYLMRDLLVETNAKLILPVRGSSRRDSWDRLKARASYYFGQDFLEPYRRRIILQLMDLGQPLLGLEASQFEGLAGSIDCIVHAAALTKHYGAYQDFVSANVDATRTLAELALRARAPLNLISTLSVGAGTIGQRRSALFTEFDCDIGQVTEHYYVKTKLAAEKLAISMRPAGLTCNIYRVGFLASDSVTRRFQENAGDSGFVQKLRGFAALGRMPYSALQHSFCPVNETSQAILQLLRIAILANETHHLEHVLEPAEAAAIGAAGSQCQVLPDAEFYAWLSEHLREPGVAQAATAILLHEGFLDREVTTQVVDVRAKTAILLARLGFAWGEVTPEQVWGMADT